MKFQKNQTAKHVTKSIAKMKAFDYIPVCSVCLKINMLLTEKSEERKLRWKNFSIDFWTVIFKFLNSILPKSYAAHKDGDKNSLLVFQ